MELYKLYKSSNPKKKYDIFVFNPKTKRVKKISFGASNYDDFTIHKDLERRKKYWARHSKKNLYNPLSPAFWSFFILWGTYPDINKNMELIMEWLKKNKPEYLVFRL